MTLFGRILKIHILNTYHDVTQIYAVYAKNEKIQMASSKERSCLQCKRLS